MADDPASLGVPECGSFVKTLQACRAQVAGQCVEVSQTMKEPMAGFDCGF